jgi:hypothetical protein
MSHVSIRAYQVKKNPFWGLLFEIEPVEILLRTACQKTPNIKKMAMRIYKFRATL